MFRRMVIALLALLVSSLSFAQVDSIQPQLPPVMRFAGALRARSSTVGVTFALYRDQEGGSPLWIETQNVTVDAAGQYSVILGSSHADGVPADMFTSNQARWLGIRTEGQEEAPRVLLVSVPYALKAGDAETLGGMPLSAFVLNPIAPTNDRLPQFRNMATAKVAMSGAINPSTSTITTNYVPLFADTAGDLTNSLIYQGANGVVGVNTSNPSSTANSKLHVNGNILLYGQTTHQVEMIGAASQGRLGQDSTGFFFASDTAGKSVRFLTTPTGGSLTAQMYVLPTGNVTIGTSTGASKLTVAGTVESTSGGFKFPNASVQAKAGVTNVNVGSGVTGGGTPDVNGNVSLGTDFTAVQARVTGACASGAALVAIAANGAVTCNTISGGGGSLTLPFSGTGTDNPPNAQGTFKVMDTTNGPAPAQGTPDPATIPAAIMGVSQGTGITTGVLGVSDGLDGVAIIGVNTSTTGDETPVIAAFSEATSGKTTLFDGEASSSLARGIELNFAVTPAQFIQASVGPSNSKTNVFVVDGSGNLSTNGTISAVGNISTQGTISAMTKNFKIDDPLDPAHKWLYHTSIESPDMKDLYDGLAVLDSHGEAWVTMPDWFQALNRDFRYQLTAVGAPGPKLYIAQEVSGNRFKIAGGKRGMKVSWLVTGIRQDAWAADNRSPVEQDKQGREIGSYYHPRNVTSADSPDVNARVAPVH